MKIKSTLNSRLSGVLPVVYHDVDSYEELRGKNITGVHAFCFYKDKLVVVYADNKGYWTPPGGGREEGETIEEAVAREVKEETNMKVVKQVAIGYQDVYEPDRIVSQSRSVCIVEPYGDFISDPDGDITKIELIDPSDCKKYFNWDKIGEHLLKRALEIKPAL